MSRENSTSNEEYQHNMDHKIEGEVPSENKIERMMCSVTNVKIWTL